MPYLLEIATTDFATTAAAVAGGADRVELCSALSEGGLTPSYGLIRQCRERFSLPLFPIIRPRGGDFLYSEEELDLMVADTRGCRALHCDGVVLGLLDREGHIPLRTLDRLLRAAYPMDVTFHRAFDRCRDPFDALEQLISAGVQRILTSGQQPTALEGKGMIAQLLQQAAGRIIIMPGSGIRPDNIKELALATGAEEFHSALRSRRESAMAFRHPAFPSETMPDAIEPDAVRALRSKLMA